MHLLKSYLKKYRKLLSVSIILATINQVFSLANPQIFRILIDEFANADVIATLSQTEFMKGVWFWLLIGVWAAAISRIAKTFQDYYVNLMSQKIWASIYADSIDHTFHLPYKVFEDWKSWSLLDKLQKARWDIQKFLESMINVAFLTSIGILIVMGYWFYVHRLIWTVFALMVPTLALTTIHLSKRIRNAQKNIVKASSELAWATVENIKNVTLIKSLWLEEQEISHLNGVNDTLIWLEIEKLKLVKSITFWQGTLINILRSLLQFILLRLVYEGSISLWEFFTLLFYSFLLFNPLYQLPRLATNLQEVKASNEILEEIHGMQKIKIPDNAIKIQKIQSLAFDWVTFGYDDSLAVENISFKANPWENIAFVWPSWAGKSTILKLLTWLYIPQKWVVSINKKATNSIDRTSMKQHISIVAQDTQLFAWTIRENLLFVSPESSDDQCLKALEQAQLIWLVEWNETWLDTRIWEWWLKLSWWQKQRLAIARALLRDPDLLIFDEATSSLDSIVEAKITETIQSIAQDNHDLISITVAHRLSTIMHADRIYVLENGKIVESWTHESLVWEKGLYFAMWRQQSGWIS